MIRALLPGRKFKFLLYTRKSGILQKFEPPGAPELFFPVFSSINMLSCIHERGFSGKPDAFCPA
jgi:hypothetical protein